MSNKMFHKFILQQRKDIENYIKYVQKNKKTVQTL